MSRRRARSGRVVGLVLVILGWAGGAAGAAGAAEAAPLGSTAVPEPRVLGSVTLTDPRLTELSGLAASLRHPGVLYAVNDSGGGPYLFAVDSRTGGTLARFRLPGAPDRDYEGLTVAPAPDRTTDRATIWVGDIGDNDSSRSRVRLLRVPEPARLVDGDLAWTQLRLTYPDGPRDAEALLADPATGQVYVVSKRFGPDAAVYLVPGRVSSGDVDRPMTRVAAAPGLVTDGAFSPDGTRVALAGYADGWLGPGWDGPWQALPLPPRPQGEALAWAADGIWVGSEGAGSTLWHLAAPAGSTPVSSGSTATATPAPPGPTQAAARDGRGRGGSWWPKALAVALLGLGVGAGLALARRRSSSARRF